MSNVMNKSNNSFNSIPFQQKVLDTLHASHLGVVKIRALRGVTFGSLALITKLKTSQNHATDAPKFKTIRGKSPYIPGNGLHHRGKGSTLIQRDRF